jgi:PAS domain S-box-containing protein
MHGSQSPAEMLGRGPLDFLAKEDHPRFLANLRRTVAEGITRDVEYSFLKKDGTAFPGAISTAVIADASGKPSALVAIIRDITERRQAREALEREKRSLWRMLQASDHERQIISYEIHDGLAQYLAGATMQFQAYDSLKQGFPKKARKAYETALELVRQGHAEARRLINEVRPPVIDDNGIETAISHLVHEQRRRGGPNIEFNSDVQFDRLPLILENALYRIVQEALTNACKYSQSKRVSVAMIQQGQDVRLEVRDRGVGFDPESVARGHFGLEGIRQRVRLLGGTLSIDSKPGSGTIVQVVVPILESRDEG